MTARNRLRGSATRRLPAPALLDAGTHGQFFGVAVRRGLAGIAVSEPGTAGRVIERCILAAATAHRVPMDIGPMQVNETWLPDLARHWRTSVPQAFVALRDDFWEGVGFYHSRNPGYSRPLPCTLGASVTRRWRCWAT